MIEDKTALILTLESPSVSSFKADLFLNTIRQHIDLGFHVFVASLEPMDRADVEHLEHLGSKVVHHVPNTQVYGIENHWTLNLKKDRRDWLLQRNVKMHIASVVKPDIVIGIQNYQTGLVAQRLGNELQIPSLTWEHISGYHLNKKLRYSERRIKSFFKNVDVVAAVSNSVLEAIEKRYRIHLPKKIVIPNAIPKRFEAPTNIQSADFKRENKNDIIFGAWTSWRNKNKRLDLLLDAFSKTKKHAPSSKLFIAGGIADKDLLSRANNQLGVSYFGPLSREKIHELACSVDFCCITSEHETFGLPAIEALACGKRVVSTRCGGTEDILQREEFGTLSDDKTSDAFSKAMLNAIKSADRYEKESIASQAMLLYSESTQLERWRDLYQTLLVDKINA